MLNEADVVHATILYVLHPITQAINTMYGNTISCCAERSNGPVRCDFVWKYFNGKSWHALAVLEVKRRGVLKETEFSGAFVDAKDVQQKIEEAYHRFDEEERDPTFLTRNAVVLSKQAAAYARKYDTQFIALFDWDSLFLYRFHGLRTTQRGVGDWAYGTWVEDEGPTNFRKSLLGLLVRACEVKLS